MWRRPDLVSFRRPGAGSRGEPRARWGACLLCRLPTLPLALPFAPIPPTPFPAGRGSPKVYFAGGFAPGTPTLNRPRHLQTLPSRHPAGHRQRRSSQCRVPSSPGDARGEAPCIRKLKVSPFPLGRGSGGWGQKSKLKAGAAGGKEGKPPARHRQRRSSQCRAPSSPGDARGEAPCIRKLKVSPFPPGRGGGGMGAVNQAKGRGDRRQRGQAPPVDSGMARSAGDQPGKPPAGHEICFLLRRLKINPVAVAFFEKPLAFLRKIWYNTIQSCTVACSCARKPARV